MMRILKVFLIVLFLISGKLLAQPPRFQIGIDVAKYARNPATIKGFPAEVVGMLWYKSKHRFYPGIAVGFGNFSFRRNNLYSETGGFYIKPKLDWYLGKMDKPVSFLFSGALLIGSYTYMQEVTIYNPVWGDMHERSKTSGNTLGGMEGGAGVAADLTKNVELKFTTGLRIGLGNNKFKHEVRGSIPGFGTASNGYYANPYVSLILSYRLD